MKWPEEYINQIICGDCLEAMKGMPDDSIDTIITDPPYGLEFMGKEWDAPWKGKAGKDFNVSCKGKLGGFKKLPNYTRGNNVKCLNCNKWKFSSNPCKCDNPIFPHTQQLAMVKYQQWTQYWATEALRVAKPGSTLLCFGGTRTYHRLVCAIEDAGWIIFDTLLWLYGQGFPKSTSIYKQLTKKGNCGIMVVYEEIKFNTRRMENKTSKLSNCESDTKYPLRFMWKIDIPQTINIKDKQGKILQSCLSKQSIYRTMQREESEEGKQRKVESCLERWGYIQTCKRELQRCKICVLSEKIFIDGEEGWLCNGTPFSDSEAYWKMLKKGGMCPSCRPQSIQQQTTESNIIPRQYNTQEIRSDAEEWRGWGTHLKPAFEPIVCARKPNEGSYANNALKWGVAGLNIDGGRIGTTKDDCRRTNRLNVKNKKYNTGIFNSGIGSDITKGRYPANVILDEEAGRMLDEQSGKLKPPWGKESESQKNTSWFSGKTDSYGKLYRDIGGASRFFYCAKASKAERNRGCEGLEEKISGGMKGTADQTLLTGSGNIRNNKAKNNHPTVKPLSLMKYLCILTKTPTGSIILDPFCGSGTTLIACKETRRKYIGIDNIPEYCEIARRKINATPEPLF